MTSGQERANFHAHPVINMTSEAFTKIFLETNIANLQTTFKGNGYNFKGGNVFRIVLSLLRKGVKSEKEEFFLFRVDTFSEETYYTGKKTGSHRSCLPFKNGKNFFECIITSQTRKLTLSAPDFRRHLSPAFVF